MATFDNFAGQLVADGIDTAVPIIPFGKTGIPSDLRVLNGVMTKIGMMFFKQPKAYIGTLDAVFNKFSMPLGGATEMVSVVSSTPNALNDGTCVPRGQPVITTQLDIANFGYSVDVEVRDEMLAKYVNTAADLASFVSMILATPSKTIGSLRWACEKNLVSNVIGGTRSIVSNTKSDESGTEVTYASGTITGYAGKVDDVDYDKADIVLANAKEICDMIEDAIDAMSYESAEYTATDSEDFITSTPNIIIEASFARRLDRVLAGVTETHPSADLTFTQRMAGLGNIIKIDSFDVLPTNVAYADKTLGVVVADPSLFSEVLMRANVESERCVKKRLTGYSYRGESVFRADRSAPAYAITMGAVTP